MFMLVFMSMTVVVMVVSVIVLDIRLCLAL